MNRILELRVGGKKGVGNKHVASGGRRAEGGGGVKMESIERDRRGWGYGSRKMGSFAALAVQLDICTTSSLYHHHFL